ncbi:Complexin-2, partial [Nibea albiflora]
CTISSVVLAVRCEADTEGNRSLVVSYWSGEVKLGLIKWCELHAEEAQPPPPLPYLPAAAPFSRSEERIDDLGHMQERSHMICKYTSVQGATKDMGKMLGGEEEKDPDAAKKEEERQEALRQQEEERKAKHARMETEREKVRQTIRDKYGLKKKEEKEAEEKAAMEQACEGSLTRPKKAIPRGCGDDDEEDEESILDTVLKFLPGPLQDMFKK